MRPSQRPMDIVHIYVYVYLGDLGPSPSVVGRGTVSTVGRSIDCRLPGRVAIRIGSWQ